MPADTSLRADGSPPIRVVSPCKMMFVTVLTIMLGSDRSGGWGCCSPPALLVAAPGRPPAILNHRIGHGFAGFGTRQQR